jgi:hypothetical protein
LSRPTSSTEDNAHCVWNAFAPFGALLDRFTLASGRDRDRVNAARVRRRLARDDA